MKNLLLVGLLILWAGCGQRHEHSHDELPGVSVTLWTEKTEVFSENRVLVAKRDTSFAVHLTDLKDSKPVTQGKITLIFKDQDGKEETFTADGPTNPGIFRPVAKINTPGHYSVTLKLTGSQVEDEHLLGEMEVYRNAHDAQHAFPEEEGLSGAISFLKEQQWKIKFKVEEVKQDELFETITAQGQVRSPLTASTPILAPATGKIAESKTGFPLLGASVTKDQILAVIVPDNSQEEIPIIAPISGVIAVAHVGVSDRVEKEWKIFDVINLTNAWIEARIYEPDLPKLENDATATIEVSGTNQILEAKNLVSIGGTLDTSSRSVPVVFEVKNDTNLLKIGSSVIVHIRTKKSAKGPVIPDSALVDEDGVMVAYVQTEGEAFERRPLTLGVREGRKVQVLEGIKAGERVVTEGAYSVRLASVSSQLPAHGHAH
jgi:membrane fusion protein, heavy metal efflux system